MKKTVSSLIALLLVLALFPVSAQAVQSRAGSILDGETGLVDTSKPGDLDLSGGVDNKDVEYLLWHTLFPNDYMLFGDADLDGDGFVDNKDVEFLLWHTLFPDDYPL